MRCEQTVTDVAGLAQGPNLAQAACSIWAAHRCRPLHAATAHAPPGAVASCSAEFLQHLIESLETARAAAAAAAGREPPAGTGRLPGLQLVLVGALGTLPLMYSQKGRGTAWWGLARPSKCRSQAWLNGQISMHPELAWCALLRCVTARISPL